MIYEYPEEFIVPVVYNDNLCDNPMYRDWDVEYVEIEGVLFPDNESQEDKLFIPDEYPNKVFEGKDKKISEFDMDLLQEPYKKNMLSYDIVKDNSKNDHVKAILEEIDNEYAKSETMRA